MNPKLDRYLVAALYKFVTLPDYGVLADRLRTLCETKGVKGLLILAPEGLNGTIAGPEASVRQVLAALRSDPRFDDIRHKESWAVGKDPMDRIRVVLRDEIVTMGIDNIDPTEHVGEYVAPADWNALLRDPEVLLIDTRNQYEVAIGTFQGAVDPKTETFRDFPNWFNENRALLKTKKKVAMFCTGGIRCEKATSFLMRQGVDEVYHLEGGILEYLAQVPADQSLWQGECYVFDKRVSVDHALAPGRYERCRGCRHPIDELARSSPLFEDSVSCPRCYDTTSEAQKARFRERRKQVALAKERGEQHVGTNTGMTKKSRDAER